MSGNFFKFFFFFLYSSPHKHKSYFAEKVEVTPDFLMTAYLSAFGEEIDSHLVWPSKQRETSNKIRTVNMRIPCTRVHKLSFEVISVIVLSRFNFVDFYLFIIFFFS